MAGDWIKFETATSDKPEVWAIASHLGIDPDAVVGKLLRVWGWFDQHTTDGNAKVTVSALLDRIVGVTGFCNSLTLAGWMSNDGDVISIPNFESHNGETAKKRCQAAKRVAKHKKTNAEVTQAPLPNALPKEEKRREEKIIKTKDKNILGIDDLVSLGVDRQHAIDWLTVRKTKGKSKPLTATALNGIITQAEASGITLAVAIGVSATEGWVGFKSEWLANLSNIETISFIQKHTDKSWRDCFVETHSDTSWAEGL